MVLCSCHSQPGSWPGSCSLMLAKPLLHLWVLCLSVGLPDLLPRPSACLPAEASRVPEEAASGTSGLVARAPEHAPGSGLLPHRWVLFLPLWSIPDWPQLLVFPPKFLPQTCSSSYDPCLPLTATHLKVFVFTSSSLSWASAFVGWPPSLASEPPQRSLTPTLATHLPQIPLGGAPLSMPAVPCLPLWLLFPWLLLPLPLGGVLPGPALSLYPPSLLAPLLTPQPYSGSSPGAHLHAPGCSASRSVVFSLFPCSLAKPEPPPDSQSEHYCHSCQSSKL